MKVTRCVLLAASVVVIGLACSLLQPGSQATGEVGPTVVATLEPATVAVPTEFTGTSGIVGTQVSFPGGTLVIPFGLANGASSEGIPAVAPDESAPWWNVAPAHVKIAFQGYALQGKFHEPQIVIYPAESYAAVNESAAAHLADLKALLADPTAPITPENLPGVPFFNAGAMIAAQSTRVAFANGSGIRTVTEYAQFYAPINNADLFFHFQGLTKDGHWYIVAILPVTAPLLAADGAPEAVPPPGGVPYPGFETIDDSLFEAYYDSVTNLLNSTAPDQFHPSITVLDALIGSMQLSE